MIATKNGKTIEIGEQSFPAPHNDHTPSFKWRSPLHTKRTVTAPSANNPGNNFDDVEVALISSSVSSKSSDSSGSSGSGGSQVQTMPASEVKLTNITSAGNSKAIAACSLYSFCSVSMIIVNKSLASRYVIYYVSLWDMVLKHVLFTRTHLLLHGNCPLFLSLLGLFQLSALV